MPRSVPSNFVPSYRLHKPSGQAVVTLSGRDHYLGANGSPASKRLYDKLVGEWIASGRQRVAHDTVARTYGSGGLTVTQFIAAYWTHVTAYYVKNGQPTSEQACIRLALDRLAGVYGDELAASFTPLALKSLRERLIVAGLKRRVINGYVDRVRRCFRWGVAEGLVDASVVQGLMALTGLRAGRSAAIESVPVGPVSDSIVETTLSELTPTVADMVRVQRVTGMRPGAVCRLTTGALDMSGTVWFYEDRDHKTVHHGKRVRIAVGPRAQAILGARLRTDLQAPIFSPVDSLDEHAAARRAARKTPRPESTGRRRNGRPQRSCYDVAAYRRAIQRACDRAFPHPTLSDIAQDKLTDEQQRELTQWQAKHRWHPHQLRHTYATEARRSGFALDHVSAALNHSGMEITQIYAERLDEHAARVAQAIG